MDYVLANTIGAALLVIAGDAVAYLPEPHQRLDVDMDHIPLVLPLVLLHRCSGFQVPHSPQLQMSESPGHAGEGRLEHPGDVAEVEPLVAEIHRLLEPLRIERSPLGAAHALSIYQ